MAAMQTLEEQATEELPFLKALSWFDAAPQQLSPLEALQRYEAGWRYLGVLDEPSPEEWRFIRALVAQYGSFLDVPS